MKLNPYRVIVLYRPENEGTTKIIQVDAKDETLILAKNEKSAELKIAAKLGASTIFMTDEVEIIVRPF